MHWNPNSVANPRVPKAHRIETPLFTGKEGEGGKSVVIPLIVELATVRAPSSPSSVFLFSVEHPPDAPFWPVDD